MPAQPAQGFELMLYGMGTVVLFLLLLVFATRLMSAILRRWFPDPEPPQRVAAMPVPAAAADRNEAPAGAAPDPQLLAAIAAAVHAHRARSVR